MKITYLTDGVHSRLIIKTCLLQFLTHIRVADAAISSAPGATVTTSGVLFITTEIYGDASAVYNARAAARRAQMN